MKRFCALLLTVLQCCGLSAALALTDDLPYEENMILRLSELTETQRTLLSQMHAAVIRHQDSYVPPAGTLYNDADAALQALITDYPELIELETRYSIVYYQNHPEIATKVNFSYRLSAAEAEETRARLIQTASEMVSSAASSDDFTTEVALYRALLERTAYDLNASAPDTADGPLLYGEAVCGGYSSALCLLLRMSGIPCSVIRGSANGDHAWCVAEIGGVRCFQDPTWDDQDQCGAIPLFYLNVGWDFFADRRTLTGGFDPSGTSDEMEFYRHMGYMAENEQEARQIILAQKSAFASEGKPVYLRMASDEALESVIGQATEWLNASITYMNRDGKLIILAQK